MRFFEDYVQEAARPECNQNNSYLRVQNSAHPSQNMQLLHSAIGMASDLEELRNYDDKQHLIEELGDVCWYMAQGFRGLEHRVHTHSPMQISFPNIQRVLDMGYAYVYSIEKCFFYGNADLQFVYDRLMELLEMVKAFCYDMDIPFEQVLQGNINKLKARYPEKFDIHKSTEEGRDREEERRAMDDGVNYDSEDMMETVPNHSPKGDPKLVHLKRCHRCGYKCRVDHAAKICPKCDESSLELV